MSSGRVRTNRPSRKPISKSFHMDIQRAFSLLDLNADSSPETVKKKYHDLAAVWHPDLHANDPQLLKLASEKMKEINSAYEIICSYLNSHMIVVCASCGAENRKRIDLNVDYAACSRCGKQLRKPMAKRYKTPCGNSRCAGTIGSNGRCNYCGKTIEEGQTSVVISADSPIAASAFRSVGIKRWVIPVVAFSGFALALYLYRDNSHHLIANRLPDQGHPAAAESAEPTVRRGADAEKPLIFRAGKQPVMPNLSDWSALLSHPNLNREAAAKLQQILKAIGYEIGEADGRIGPRTISCFRQFCVDFGYRPQESFPDCFFKTSFLHYQIALDHRDWLDIYLTNDLENWMRTLSDSHRKQISQLPLNQPNTVVQLVRRYKFEKFKPVPAYLPETGIIKKNYATASEHLKIKTITENNNYYVKLIDQATLREILTAFIRSGGTLSVKVPSGSYELKYAAGPNWYGLDYLFGTSSSYGKIPQPIVFPHKSLIDGPQTIELTPGRHGRLTTEIISEYDF